MHGGGRVGVADTVFPKLFLCLGNAKQVRNQFCAAHIVENFLTDFQILLSMNVVHGHTAIQTHISGILKYSEFLCRNHTGVPCGFGKQLIPLLDIAANDQSAAVFVQLIKPVCHFLTVGLDGKVSLSQCDDLFAWVAILHNQIAGIAGQFIVDNAFRCRTGFNDFPDLRKIGRGIMPAVFAGDHCALNDLGKILPLCIVQN